MQMTDTSPFDRAEREYEDTLSLTLGPASVPWGNMSGQTIRVFERCFEPVFDSAGQARRFARAAAADLGRVDASERIEALVGELSVNAILHAQTPYRLSISRPCNDVLRVEVFDANPDLPRIKPATGDDVLIHGRGMALIERLADRWGVLPGQGGKCIWVELGLRIETSMPTREPTRGRSGQGDTEPPPVEISPEIQTVTLRDLATRDLLGMIEHLDDVIREISLVAAGARSGTARATLPEYVMTAMDRVRPILYAQKEAISRQVASAWRRGEPTLDVTVELAPSAAPTIREVLEVFEVLDDVAIGDRAMLLPATRPEVFDFRRRFFTRVAEELGGATETPELSPDDGLDRVRTVRTLVVDDSADMRLLLRMMLGRDRGFEVVGEAADGQAAIEATQRHRPDLVVMDRQMPILGGLEAIPLIRERFPDTEIVLYTAAVEPDTEEAAATAGAIGVLTKGGVAADVAQELTRLLARHRPSAEVVEVRLGPVASSAARVWVANTRQLLKALRLHPELIGGPLRESVMAMFGRFLDAWAAVAADTEVFFWTGRAEPADVREVIEQWARIDAMDETALAALGCRWSPPEGQPFFAALTTAVVEALAGHGETLALAQRLGGDWSVGPA